MTRFIDFTYPVTGGTTSRKEPDRWLDYGINIKEFGAVGDNTHDDTANIQAAIDYAFNNNIEDIYIPNGIYKTTAPIYIDPPGNLRSSLLNPTNFSFSTNFHGSGAIGNNNQRGPVFKPVTNDFVVFYVGPGQGMRLSNFSIIGPSTFYRGLQPSTGIGIGVAGGNGGASRTLISEVGIQNFYVGIATAANGNGTLCDSTTLFKCWIDNAYIGIDFPGTQNFINSAISCNPNNCTIALSASPGVGCVVEGGNYSAAGCVAEAFTISAISAVTATPTGNTYDYSFTATISSPDIYVGTVYNAYAIVTAHMGVIPLLMTAYNSGTHVGSFQALNSYSYFNWSANNAVTNADLQAEIQAVATIYAAEQVTVFQGSGITVKGVHIENNAPTKLFHSEETIGQHRVNDCDNIFFDEDPSFPNYAPAYSPATTFLARYYIAMTFPFIWIKNTSLHIEDSDLGIGGDPLPIDFENEASLPYSFKLERCTRYRFNVRSGENGGFYPYIPNSANFGSGEYDISPFVCGNAGSGPADGSQWRLNAGQAPQWGVRPAPYTRPAIFVSDVATLKAALPAFTYIAQLNGGIGSAFGATLTSGGAGYTAGDVLTMVGGVFSTAAQITVFTVAAGVITAWYTSRAGSYTTAPASFTVTGGTGAGATFGSPQWQTTTTIGYPLIWGGQQYALYDWFVGNQPAGYSCVSDHHFYTYGQDLTTTNVPQLSWYYKGKSFAVYVNDQTLIFPGLGVTLNDGVSDVLYIVTGTYPGLGYFTVSATTYSGDYGRLSGVKTNIITGTTIKQEAFSVTQF